MKNKLYILTTATPRKELHVNSLAPLLRELREDIDLTWLVNFDVPLAMKDRSRNQEAREYLEGLSDIFIYNDETPCFPLAGRNLYNKCNEIIDRKENNLFLWLEDDWYIYPAHIRAFKHKIHDLFDSDISCVLTTRYGYVGGNPVVFKLPLFDNIVEVYAQNPTLMLDPEYAHFQAQANLDGTHWRHPPKKGHQFRTPIFHDVGREWRKRNHLGKISRDRHSPVTWTEDKKGKSNL